LIADTTSNIKVKKQRGALLVHEQLRSDILWMRLEPGSALDEVALALRFGVSRTPIREALLLLSGESLVLFLPNRTTIVAPLSLNNAREYFDTLLVLGRSVMRAAALSKHHDPSIFRALCASYDAAIQAGEPEDILKIQLDIYHALASVTGNMFLEKYFCEALDAGVRTKLLHYYTNASTNELKQTAQSMNTLVGYILDEDAANSDVSMRDIILLEAKIVVRSIYPAFGHQMDIDIPISVQENAL
jgi:DNA-binding GntR family transcriptional regulator